MTKLNWLLLSLVVIMALVKAIFYVKHEDSFSDEMTKSIEKCEHNNKWPCNN